MKKGNQSPSGGGWRIAPFGKGKSPLLSANHADSIKALNALGRITIVRDEAATSDKVIYGGDNIVIKIAGAADGGSTPGAIQVAKITSAPAESASTITCVEFNGGIAGDAITVAKPSLLRGLTGNQKAYPFYEVDDLLLIMSVPDGVGISTEWTDLNIDGRNIARETKGCDEEGNPVYAMVARSEWYSTPIGSDFS